MLNARRIYAYLVSAISLATLLGAVSWLLRDLLVAEHFSTTAEKALNIAILIIGVPVYVGHWLWQQRLAGHSQEERSALERRVYLYAVIAGMIGVITYQGYYLARVLLDVPSTEPDSLLYYLIPIVLAALIYGYHATLLAADVREAPETGNAGTVRRLYIFVFVAAGMTMIALSANELIRWLLSQVSVWLFDAMPLGVAIRPELARLLIGLPLWAIYWRWAQQLFASDAEERESVLRKFYLYAAIFIGTVGTVSSTAMLLAGFFRQILGLEVEGELRDLLALIISFAVLWFYHSLILREDLRAGEATAQQAEMRRLYLYLVAATGLVALVSGVISEISALLSIADDGINDGYRGQLAYSTAAIIAGLPVWFLAWRQLQQEAGRDDQVGAQARRSSIRKAYIYFFQFVSIMAILGSAIYVVSEAVTGILLGSTVEMTDISLALAIAAVHLLVWLYHLATLRADRKRSISDEMRQLEDMGLVLLQKSDDHSISIVDNEALGLSPEVRLASARNGSESAGQPERDLPTILERLAAAQTIVLPWTLLVPRAEDGEAALQVAQAVIASPARKVVLPVASPGWVWVGTESIDEEKVSQKALETLRQLSSGEKIRGSRKLGCGTIALIALGIFVLLIIGSLLYFVLFPY